MCLFNSGDTGVKGTLCQSKKKTKKNKVPVCLIMFGYVIVCVGNRRATNSA